MSDNHTCGYRRVQGLALADSPFRMSGEGLDHYREDGSCSFCGSVSQEAFLAFVEAGGEVGPTDKDYKAYLHGDNAPGSKFYFYHLDEAGQRRFIDLYNENKVRLGYPGYFYALPFFCSRRQPA